MGDTDAPEEDVPDMQPDRRLDDATTLSDRRLNEATTLSNRRLDEATTRSDRRRDEAAGRSDRLRDEADALSNRRRDEAAGRVFDADDATMIAPRTDAPAAATSIAHGRADTPRSASTPPPPGASSVYPPRGPSGTAPVTRAPVTPPPPRIAPTGVSGSRRTGRGVLVATLFGGTVLIVGAGIALIMMFVGGG
ncbi:MULTISPECIES: hypothetical protein [unclassified Microbacterium]|uniref:hypothetical protein n=1 Tax=unclassified Microbacterium TaxID=2609290 RepID=UPI00386B9A2D